MFLPKTTRGFSHLAVATLLLTFLVILWGAFTRLSGSGDGCGESWPLCLGVILPRSPSIETAIEFLHRLSSGTVFVMAALLALSAPRLFTASHPARRAARASFWFMLAEAGIGAVLVLFGWVDRNESVQRVLSLTLHLINTFFLVSALARTAYFSSADQEGWEDIDQAKGDRRSTWILRFGFVLLCLSGIGGTLAALSTMLYPAASFWEGVQADFDPNSPLLVQLRIWHPVLSLLAVGYVLWTIVLFRDRFVALAGRGRTTPNILFALMCLQICLGPITLVLGKLVVLKLLHLLVADLMVAMFAIFSGEVLIGMKARRLIVRPSVLPATSPASATDVRTLQSTTLSNATS